GCPRGELMRYSQTLYDADSLDEQERSSHAPIAPGKRTLTMGLPRRQAAPVQRKEAPAAQPRDATPAAQPGADWTNVVFRPDVWSAPERRAPLQDKGIGAAAAGHGAAMPAPVQARMEHAFGADFSDVRVHPGSAQATSLGALAFA